MAELLRQLPENPEWGGFIPRILARFNPVPEQVVAQQPKRRAEDARIIDLTNRETDVLILLCERLYDKEIADRLCIATSTVKNHLSHIYSKLEVANRREAMRMA